MTASSPNGRGSGRTHRVVWLVIGVCGVLALILVGSGGHVQEWLIGSLTWMQTFQREQPGLALVSAFILYVIVTGLSLPGAALMSLAYGWMFGFWRALLLVSFASTLGATIAFLMSRYLLRDLFQRQFGPRLETVQAALEREGAFYLFSLRLIPVFPFFVVNALMGLTRLPMRTFWWVSQLGMLPGTAVYIYAGTSLPGLEALRNPSFTRILNPQLLIAFTLLGLFPLVIRWIWQRISASRQ